MDIRSLAGVGWDELAAAFDAAFRDYAVAMTMTPVALAHMQRRRGYDAEASYGAFEADRLVGFALTCRDGDRIYNSGTGVAPSHRRRGLARALIDEVIASVPARAYVLEVLEANASAIALYAAAGFVETRRLQAWTYEAHGAVAAVPEVTHADLATLAGDADVELAWQCSLASIARATEPHVVIGDERGAAVVFPQSADVPLLVVPRAQRRRGHGTHLIAAAAALAARPLRILNIDARADGIAAFLARVGARPLVRQLEMVRVAPAIT